jgi:hypothetical protein
MNTIDDVLKKLVFDTDMAADDKTAKLTAVLAAKQTLYTDLLELIEQSVDPEYGIWVDKDQLRTKLTDYMGIE